ncbi:MAG: class I SAM-dependent DNA methyltransferase [Thermoleophilia bacterium]
MSLTGEEIRRNLQVFAARWSVYDRSERAEAQTFLNELFACYGTDRQEVATFEEPQAGRFLDLLWPRVAIIEMKAPSEARRLDRHRPQALDYWRNAADPERNVPAPRFVVICAFRRLEVWEPGAYPNAPRVVLDLVELPDHYDALLFLAGNEPVFMGGEVELTRDAVGWITTLFGALKERRAAGPDVLRDFVLQCVWCLFAEDLGLLPEHIFTRLLDGLVAAPNRSSADELGGLFRVLNDPAPTRPQHGQYARVPYANGGLFAEPAAVHLDADELNLLRAAAGYDWTKVQPQIFGSLLEGGLGHDKQWLLGAHYTAEADIQKVVQPTIVRPWTERIENLSTHAQAKRAQADLMNFVVLDPACGSGNFLYVAYRELRRLEARLRQRESELRRRGGLSDQGSLAAFFPVSNLKGLDIDGFAVGLARVVIWMGHKLAVEELGLSETTLPLADLSGIRPGDALSMPWPRADVIIGNPPFHGDRRLRGILGDDYIEWLKQAFGVGVKDYCVYWFRKAHDHLADGGRAGLVGTNSISQNRARSASLDYIVGNGGVVTEAVSTQDWSGEAAVDVSIVNWIKNPATPPSVVVLDGMEVSGVTTALRPASAVAIEGAHALAGNALRAFQGPIPRGAGFVIDVHTASALLADGGAPYADVVRQYIVGADITDDVRQQPSRFIVDFNEMSLEQAMNYPSALALVRRDVLPQRVDDTGVLLPEFAGNWWRLWRPRPALRAAIAGMRRYVVGTATGKRILFAWVDMRTLSSNASNAFAFEDDYAMGILSSRLHGEWARAQSSTLEDRIRYTPTSAFETFPWPPAPTDAQRQAVSDAAVELLRRRREICVAQHIGLTTLYNQVDEGAWTDLRRLHVRLDEAVAAAYGWPASVAHDAEDANRRLLELNHQIASGAVEYDPFT